MNDNDIIKALKRRLHLMQSIENLFKQKDTEIDILIRKNETLKDEVSELKEELFFTKQKRANIFELLEKYEQGRIAGMKEFAECLKLRFISERLREVIDETLTELTERKEDEE